MKIFVTGGAGFIGRHLVRHLLKEHQVTIYDNLSNSSELSISNLDNVDFVKGDILDYNTLLKSCKDYDVIIHLAAKIDVAESIIHPEETINVNVQGTENVLKCCIKNKIKKIVFASSAAVYGKTDHAITEKDITHPISPYGTSKLLAENKIISATQENNLDAIILRVFNAYGKGQTEQYAGVITKFTKNITQEIPLEIYGDGKQTRDFISIRDVVEAFHCALKNIRKKKRNTYNIGTGKATSIIELAETMIKISKKKIKINYLDVKEEIKHSVTNITLAKNELGFNAKIKLKDELVKTRLGHALD